LVDYNWQPVVLTVKNGSYPSYDPSLEKQIPDHVKVYRTKTIEPFAIYNRLLGKRGKSLPVGLVNEGHGKKNMLKNLMFFIRANFFVPDARKGWKRYAYPKAKKIIKEENIAAIITTGPPHSTHLTGLALKKRFGLPWIVDYRDPWTNIYYNKSFHRTKNTEIKDKRLEDKVTGSADIVTVVSNGLLKEFDDRANKIKVLPNGFDAQEIPVKEGKKTERFVLSYIGNFKANQNILGLWDAVNDLLSEGIINNQQFNIEITGNTDPSVLKTIHNKKLESIVTIKPFVDHKRALQLMVDANLLLFIVPKAINNHLIITGKLFEYLASKSPIISIGPLDGDAAKIIQSNQRHPMIDYNDKQSIKNQLVSCYNKWQNTNGRLEIAQDSDLSKYTRKGLTQQLANYLGSLIQQPT
jgi:hypothetical protein